jgi:hypothetical protein
LKEKRYRLASQALRKAGLEHDAAVADAFYLLDQLDHISSADPQRLQVLRRAGDAFTAAAASDPADSKRLEYFAISANCFLGIPDVPKAAASFLQAREYSRAVILYRSVPLFEQALHVIRQYRANMDPSFVDKVIYAAKLFYFTQQRME